MATLTAEETAADAVLAEHVEPCAANALFCATDNGVAADQVRVHAAMYLSEGMADCRCPETYPGRTLTDFGRQELAKHVKRCIDNAETSAGENGATYEQAVEWAAIYLNGGSVECMCNPED